MDVAIEQVARSLDAALPHTRVGTVEGPRTVRCEDVVERSGDDPLAAWRTATRRQMEARHGTAVPAHVPAAFVLQWWCEAVATPVAYAAQLGPWVLRGPAGLGFELAAGLYPQTLVLSPGRPGTPTQGSQPGLSVEVVEREEERSERARAAYGEVVDPVVRDFAPDVRMGSRQRWGVVEDMWVTARRRAAPACGTDEGPAPWRTSCCFVYSLPGLRACATCPRRRRS